MRTTKMFISSCASAKDVGDFLAFLPKETSFYAASSFSVSTHTILSVITGLCFPKSTTQDLDL